VSTTLVIFDNDNPDRFVTRPSRAFDRVLARLGASALDRQLAAGRPPEANRFLAARANELVLISSRQALARDWEHILQMSRRLPVSRNPRVPLCRDRIVGAEDDVHEIVTWLSAAMPLSARGVAMASVLLSDAGGPLCNRHCSEDLHTALRAVIEQLDPRAPLLASA
jgi:hypothetical protein